MLRDFLITEVFLKICIQVTWTRQSPVPAGSNLAEIGLIPAPKALLSSASC